MSIVFVIDCEGQPLLPTHPARARKLLREGKARVKQVVPFTIQLYRKIDGPVGNFEFGVDDGAKHVGFAIKNLKTEEVVFHAEMEQRQDVKLKMEQRKKYRRARRYLKTRCRAPRFNNRKGSKLAPSIRQRKEAIVRVLKDFQKRLNVVKVKVEEVSFNHAEKPWGHWFSLVEIGKNYLRKQIENLGLSYKATFGYITKEKRLELGLSKRHSHDACAIVDSNKIVGPEYFIKPRRTKVWENNPTKTCDEKNGFRHYDVVRAICADKVIIGSIRSLKINRITLRTKNDDNFGVSYKKTKLLQRFQGLIYSW